jgi:hypothetical protein
MDIVASLLSTKANTLPLPTTDDTKDALLQPKPMFTQLSLYRQSLPPPSSNNKFTAETDATAAIAHSMELKKSERL